MKSFYKYYLNQPVYARLASILILGSVCLFVVIKVSDAIFLSQLNETEKCYAEATSEIETLGCEIDELKLKNGI